MATKHIDFNIDIAQGFGIYKNSIEEELLDYVSSVNISCGFHAGDPLLIKNYLLKCKEKNITIGAHIGFNDIQGLGYRPMDLCYEELEAIILYQLGAIISFAKAYKLVVDHVRPHGAMYKMASENINFAINMAKIIQKMDKWLVLTGLDNDILTQVSDETGIIVNRELFVDKYYNQDFSFDWENKKYIFNDEVLNRIRTVLFSSQIKLGNGIFMPVNCTTLHFDTKNPNALTLLKNANEIIKPTSFNYNKAELSGWV